MVIVSPVVVTAFAVVAPERPIFNSACERPVDVVALDVGDKPPALVSVFHCQVCRKFKLSIEFVAVAARRLFIGTVNVRGSVQVVVPDPFVVRAYPFVPPDVGNVNVHVPAAAAGCIVTIPVPDPANPNVPNTPLLAPNCNNVVGALLPIPTLPAGTSNA